MPISRHYRTGSRQEETQEPPLTLNECIETLFVAKGALINAVPESALVATQNSMLAVITFLKKQQAQPHVNTLTDTQLDRFINVSEFYDNIDKNHGDIPNRVKAAMNLLQVSAIAEKPLKPEENAAIRDLIGQMNNLLTLAMPAIESVLENNDHSGED